MVAVAPGLLDLVVALASGQPTKSETQGIGETELIACIWARHSERAL
jgi:hypothetical protein